MPSGKDLEDGFSTIITMANAANVAFWEQSVKPPGFDGGDLIPQTTMRNSVWRTFAPRKLKTLTAMTFKAAYDPKVIGDINNQMNINQLYTVTHSNGAKWSFYGVLNKFDPDEETEGNKPTASCTITPTNRDNTGAEVGPTYTAPPTTTSTTTTTLA
jgi:hypothetical protein